ncbi:hypothetical protein ACWYXJ_29540 [Janthinobacterium lividum]
MFLQLVIGRALAGAAGAAGAPRAADAVPTPGRRCAPSSARRLAGATLFLQLVIGRALAGAAGAAGAPRAADAVPTPGRRCAPSSARRLAGATLFLQLVIGRALAGAAGAAGAPRAADAVASTTNPVREKSKFKRSSSFRDVSDAVGNEKKEPELLFYIADGYYRVTSGASAVNALNWGKDIGAH